MRKIPNSPPAGPRPEPPPAPQGGPQAREVVRLRNAVDGLRTELAKLSHLEWRTRLRRGKVKQMEQVLKDYTIELAMNTEPKDIAPPMLELVREYLNL